VLWSAAPFRRFLSLNARERKKESGEMRRTPQESLLQNQLVAARDAEAINFAIMFDTDLALAFEELLRGDDPR
jgi:hypothetical protein